MVDLLVSSFADVGDACGVLGAAGGLRRSGLVPRLCSFLGQSVASPALCSAANCVRLLTCSSRPLLTQHTAVLTDSALLFHAQTSNLSSFYAQELHMSSYAQNNRDDEENANNSNTTNAGKGEDLLGLSEGDCWHCFHRTGPKNR